MDAEETLRAQLELAQRLLAPQIGETEIALRPGELALDVPAPDGTRIVGSLLLDGQPARVVLDTPLDVPDALAFYEERLPAQEWSRDTMGPRGGFVPSAPAYFPSRYVSDTRGMALMLVAAERPEGGSTVQMTIVDAPDPAERKRMLRNQDAHGQAMPALVAPRGSTLMPDGSSGSGESWRTYARLTAALDTSAVAEHFNRQLAAAGWSLQDAAAAGAAGWSMWSVTAEKRAMIGALVVLRVPRQPDHYFLEARIEARDVRTGGGWTSYASLGIRNRRR